ncbi:hypothetical protein D3C84_1260910 [compost metagenome]
MARSGNLALRSVERQITVVLQVDHGFLYFAGGHRYGLLQVTQTSIWCAVEDH